MQYKTWKKGGADQPCGKKLKRQIHVMNEPEMIADSVRPPAHPDGVNVLDGNDKMRLQITI